MTDIGMKGRVKGLLGGTSIFDEPMEYMEQATDPNSQHQALQVLNLAQRTAEEHIANAQRQAEQIFAEARATAEQIVREAQAHAQGLRQEADQVLAEAHAAAAQIAQDAQAHADRAQNNAEDILSDARARADDLVKRAQSDTDELKHRAEQRYQDVVGSLATKREALQQQIEALEQFDREYRNRLTGFMQNQLRALWVNEPQVAGEMDHDDSVWVEEPEVTGEIEQAIVSTTASLPAQRGDSDEPL